MNTRPLLQALLTQCTPDQNALFNSIYGNVNVIDEDVLSDAIAYVQEMIDENMQSWQMMGRPNRKKR